MYENVFKQFIMFVTSLDLSEIEIKKLASSLKEPQIQKIINYLAENSDKAQWCSILVDQILLPDNLRLLMEQL